MPLSPQILQMANQVKIRDRGGYVYTIPENNISEAAIDISSYTKVKHPNLFIDMRSAYSYTQFLALFRIAISLQPIIRTNFDTPDGKISIQAKNVYWDRESHIVEIVLPLREHLIDSHFSHIINPLINILNIIQSIHIVICCFL